MATTSWSLEICNGHFFQFYGLLKNIFDNEIQTLYTPSTNRWWMNLYILQISSACFHILRKIKCLCETIKCDVLQQLWIQALSSFYTACSYLQKTMAEMAAVLYSAQTSVSQVFSTLMHKKEKNAQSSHHVVDYSAESTMPFMDNNPLTPTPQQQARSS